MSEGIEDCLRFNDKPHHPSNLYLEPLGKHFKYHFIFCVVTSSLSMKEATLLLWNLRKSFSLIIQVIKPMFRLIVFEYQVKQMPKKII